MDILNNINWSQPTWDLFIVLMFFIGAFLYGLSLGRDRILVILTSIYMALAIVNSAPYLNNSFNIGLVVNGQSVFRVTLFIGTFLLLFFLLGRTAVANTFAADSSGRWWHSIVFSFFHVGLLLSIILQYLPKDFLSNISAPMQYYLISEPARFFWLVAPIFAMVLLGQKKEDK